MPKISNGYPSHLDNAKVITMPYNGIIWLNLPQEICNICSSYLEVSSLRYSYARFFLIILESDILSSERGFLFALISIVPFDVLFYNLVLFVFMILFWSWCDLSFYIIDYHLLSLIYYSWYLEHWWAYYSGSLVSYLLFTLHLLSAMHLNLTRMEK